MNQDVLTAFAKFSAAKNKLERAKDAYYIEFGTERKRYTEARKAKGDRLYQAVLNARREYETALENWRNAPHPYGYTEPTPV